MTRPDFRLAIVSTHPIQYNAPWFRLLAEKQGISIKIFYTWSQSKGGTQYDPGFGKMVAWDIPLLEGYDYTFVENVSSDPGTHHYWGIKNPTLIREIEQWSPNAVLVFGWNFQSHLHCIRHFHKRIPVLFRGDSTMLDERFGLRRLTRRYFLQWVYRHVDLAFYVGRRNYEYFERHGLKPQQLHFAPHAIDNDRFAAPDEVYAEAARDWRKELGIAENEFLLLFAGKLEYKKNPQFLFQLMEKIGTAAVKVLFVGNGAMEQKLKERAAGDPRFLFLDFQNQQQMPIIYRMCDTFVLPSIGPGETWGLAVNEAMACGRPVMVSDRAGCAADLVQQYKNGVVFSPQRPEICLAFLAPLLLGKAKTDKMGQLSRELVSTYSFQAIVNKIDEAVKALPTT
jgi:glycosyltransferase involved in cell wall biosynthesis